MKLHPNAEDLTGRRFGRLVVIECGGRRYTPSGCSTVYWRCRCDCGGEKTTRATHLKSGAAQSCGCYMRQRNSETHRSHGRSATTEYSIWTNMKDRCLNAKGIAYKDWGGRGITLCDEWAGSFEKFYQDMGPRPSPEHELDRENNDGPYCKANCRWAVKLVQANNKRNNVHVTINGETLTVAQWSRVSGVRDNVIHKRLKRGWSAHDAVFIANGSVRKWRRCPSQGSRGANNAPVSV